MHKIYCFVLFVTFSLYGQINNVLFIHPNGAKYKKVEMGLKLELKNKMNIISLVSRSEAEILNVIDINSPKIVIVSNMEIIRIWKKIKQKHQEINQIPFILLESEFLGVDINYLTNCCIVTYEPKLEHYIDKVAYLTGKKPLNIGVIYSSKTTDLIQSYQKECSQLNVNMYAKQVIVSDPENSIKTVVDNLTDHYNVDFVLIPDDPVTINNQIISTTWVSLLAKLDIPIAVPADYFYEIEPRIGSFAIQPHYSAIGGVIGSVINEMELNNWEIIQKSMYTDKSIFYFRNSDGSIGKKNQVKNKIIASYHPKVKTNSSGQQLKSETLLDSQKTLASNALSQVASEKSEHNVFQQSLDSENEIKNSKTEKKPAIVSTTIDNKNIRRLNDVDIAESETDQKQKISVTADVINANANQTSQPDDFPAKQPIEEKPYLFIASKNDTYNIEITAPRVDIYKHLTPQRQLLGGGNKGDELVVTSEDSFWYCVNFLEDKGYLSKSAAIKLPQKKYNLKLRRFDSFLIVFVIISLIAVYLLVHLLLKSKRRMHNDVSRNNCVLISKRKKQIKYSNKNNACILLSKYLKNCGFNIIMSRHLKQTSDILLFNLPEIICIDWQFDSDIQKKMHKILKEQMVPMDFILIFYNVIESSDIKMGYFLEDRTFFLSTDFTASDISNILSMVKARSDTQRQLNDTLNSQLEGKIMEDTLSEILQMMDINKKTGCLIVENNHPDGMIFFEDGIITYSITNTQSAEAAVFEILSMKHGRFHFLPGKRPLSRQMQLSIVAVLMERAKYLDEIQIVE